ncbi:Trehalose utilization [Novipirellula galeiformis]|uniref:Trehalose utilization n=1 Tax=Novipirellula galeiformis TaxID=2528004 RepID=A0A5C6CQ12_9BACT|nr:ThuA domain-containing protein [Novipirellula galeiformis]TWU26428.1 Trehalose utilization [Novipirellula galeiformis]
MNLRAVACLLIACCLSPHAIAEPLPPHLVMLIAEREYETEKTLPKFAEQHLQKAFRTSLVFADKEDRNTLVGSEAIRDADVLLVSVRRRALPKSQLKLIRDHVAQGKPVIGIRTANHAFALRNEASPPGHDQWLAWDREVFGGNYSGHYKDTLITTVTIRNDNSIPATLLSDIKTESFVSRGSLYKVAPLADGAVVLMDGKVEGQGSEPIAWTFTRADGGKSFYTSLGYRDDFAAEVLPQLLLNAIHWSLEK